MNHPQNAWIEQGYQTFALEGPQGLKVERLAKAVGKNKSSFYHYFADLEVFTNILLTHHLAQAHILAEKESACTSQSELIDLMVDHKVDLLFNRQLRIHRENRDFETCFETTNQLTGEAIIGLWAEILGLSDNSYLAALVLKLSLENFFLQITDETLNHQWLNTYFQELHTLIAAFRNNEAQHFLKR